MGMASRFPGCPEPACFGAALLGEVALVSAAS